MIDIPLLPPMHVVAEGAAPEDGVWRIYVSDGATPFMAIEVEFADGRRDGGGFGQETLRDDMVMAVYHGRSDGGPLSILCRAKPTVARVRLEGRALPGDAWDLEPVAALANVGNDGEVLFAAVAPREAVFQRATAHDADGQTVDLHDIISPR